MWGKISAKLKGWRTIIWSGFLAIAGGAVAILQAVNVDMIGIVLPDKYKPYGPVIAPLVIAAIGVITGWLRYVTTTPIGSDQPLQPTPLVPKAGE